MKKILLYIILFLSGIDGAWALPIEKETSCFRDGL